MVMNAPVAFWPGTVLRVQALSIDICARALLTNAAAMAKAARLDVVVMEKDFMDGSLVGNEKK
jgi:flavoprotein